ncbi:MAG: hypothetical protein ACYTBP_05010 [Planctomycetota bacterium]|jgi:hypothetical protein
MVCRLRVPFILISVLLVILCGCGPQISKTRPICPGSGLVSESLSRLEQQEDDTLSFRANGQCRLDYFEKGKAKRESFSIKLWIDGPSRIRFWGDVLFNSKGIDLGSNEEEFWFGLKPKELGNSYYWGRWSEQSGVRGLVIDPKLLLEALGVVQINDEAGWTLSNEGPWDILTQRDASDAIIKRVYIYSCDYRVSKIEYFDDKNEVAIVAELEYRKKFRGISAANFIRITTGSGEEELKFSITLNSMKPFEFDEKKQKVFFVRKGPKGFKNEYRIVDGKAYKEQVE